MTALVSQFDCILCDLDGVVYLGKSGVPDAVSTLRTLRERGIKQAFVTNNASRSPVEVADHLRDLGIEAAPTEVVTSAQAGAQILSQLVPAGSKIYVVGGAGIDLALLSVGLVPKRDPAACVAVLQGFGPSVDWGHLAEAAYLIQRGAKWVATNLDLTFPTGQGLAPGNGSLVQAVANAAGREPDGIGGKPAPALFSLAMSRMGSHCPLVVGDRYDTDIAGGHDMGIDTLLVLTGVSSIADVWRSKIRATFLGETLCTLLEDYPECTVEKNSAWCEDARAVFDPNGNLITAMGGTSISQLRAAEALKWSLKEWDASAVHSHNEISLELADGSSVSWG